MTTIQDIRLLSIAEVADKLGVSKSTVRRISKSEQIKSIRVGERRILFRPRDVEEYINGR